MIAVRFMSSRIRTLKLSIVGIASSPNLSIPISCADNAFVDGKRPTDLPRHSAPVPLT